MCNLYGKETELCNCLQACQFFFSDSGTTHIMVPKLNRFCSIFADALHYPSFNMKGTENEEHMYDNTLYLNEWKWMCPHIKSDTIRYHHNIMSASISVSTCLSSLDNLALSSKISQWDDPMREQEGAWNRPSSIWRWYLCYAMSSCG